MKPVTRGRVALTAPLRAPLLPPFSALRDPSDYTGSPRQLTIVSQGQLIRKRNLSSTSIPHLPCNMRSHGFWELGGRTSVGSCSPMCPGGLTADLFCSSWGTCCRLMKWQALGQTLTVSEVGLVSTTVSGVAQVIGQKA